MANDRCVYQDDIFEIVSEDETEDSNCLSYSIRKANTVIEYGHIIFQEGVVEEEGVNGCRPKDLINVLIDKLQGDKDTELWCPEVELVISKLREALFWMSYRINAPRK